MSQLGSFFHNLNFFLDSRHVDMATLADSHEVAATLAMTICTVHVHVFCFCLFFHTKALLEPDKFWRNVQDFREKLTGRMPRCCFCHYFCMLPHLQIGLSHNSKFAHSIYNAHSIPLFETKQ